MNKSEKWIRDNFGDVLRQTAKDENREFKTKMQEIEDKYGLDFGTKHPSEITEYLKEKGYPSLAELLKEQDE